MRRGRGDRREQCRRERIDGRKGRGGGKGKKEESQRVQDECGEGKGKGKKVKGRREGKWNGREQLGRKQKRRLMVASAVVRGEETWGT